MVWKIYAWSILLLGVVTLMGRLVFHIKRPGSTAYWDLLEAALNLVLMPGLFGFVYGRAYLLRAFWQVLVPLAWAGLLYGMFSPTHRKLARAKGVAIALLASLASLALTVPGMVAITLYGYSRSDIWR